MISIYLVDKKSTDILSTTAVKHLNMILGFDKIEENFIFTKDIQKAQKISAIKAKQSYTKALLPHSKKGFSIALDEDGQKLNSIEFANLLKDKILINFFIGGAYGFEKEFTSSCDKTISLSPLTFSHTLAKVVLYEQIYRGLSILNNHPYHKE